MSAREGRVKVEIIALLLQEDVAEMGVSVSDHRHGGLRGLQRALAALDQFAQRRRLLDTLDDPTITHQVSECHASLFVFSIARQSNRFPAIKAVEAASRQAVPE